MNFFTILLLVVTINTPTLVLRDGTRIEVEGGVKSENGKVTFRSNGALFSLPVAEVDLDATRNATPPPTRETQKSSSKIKVTAEERDRLLREIEKNHSGTPAPPAPVAAAPAAAATTTPAVTVVAPAEKTAEEKKNEEWRWRKEARVYLEAVQQAKEELALLQQEQENLKNRIAGYLSLGYRPQAISYDTTRLVKIEEQIPRAELELARAKRAYEQFYEDARRQGARPGWLD